MKQALYFQRTSISAMTNETTFTKTHIVPISLIINCNEEMKRMQIIVDTTASVGLVVVDVTSDPGSLTILHWEGDRVLMVVLRAHGLG